jgi:hypothetical protein
MASPDPTRGLIFDVWKSIYILAKLLAFNKKSSWIYEI